MNILDIRINRNSLLQFQPPLIDIIVQMRNMT